jgi:hypothetical protein
MAQGLLTVAMIREIDWEENRCLTLADLTCPLSFEAWGAGNTTPHHDQVLTSVDDGLFTERGAQKVIAIATT